MFTKEDYYAAYLHMRVLHFNATECGSFQDYVEHFAASQAAERMRQDISPSELAEVEAEVDAIFADESRCAECRAYIAYSAPSRCLKCRKAA